MTLLLCLSALHFSAPATAVTVVGEVHAEIDGERKPVARFDRLPEGATLVTKRRARASLRLQSGTLVRVGPSTTLHLTALNHDERRPARRKEGIKLTVGRIWASVTGLFGKDSSFEVQGRNAVAGVRGTSFFMTTSDEGDEIVVDEGVVDIVEDGVVTRLGGPGAAFRGSGPVQVSPLAIRELQESIGGGSAAYLQSLETSSTPGGSPANMLRFRQEASGQDEVADTPFSAPGADPARDIANITIRLVPAN